MLPNLAGMRVSRSRLPEQIVEQLKELIILKQLSVGDKLPSERTLAEQLGVSRSIVREAVKLLEQQGLLSVQVGRGTFITSVQPEAITDSLNMMLRQQGSLTFDHVYAIRRMIEVETARIAAHSATEDDIGELERWLQEMIDNQHDIERFSFADTEFHKMLARATENPLFLVLLMPITNLLREIQRTASRTFGGPSDAVYYHRRIVDAVRNHDADGAGAAMREHLESVMKWLKAAQEDHQS